MLCVTSTAVSPCWSPQGPTQGVFVREVSGTPLALKMARPTQDIGWTFQVTVQASCVCLCVCVCSSFMSEVMSVPNLIRVQICSNPAMESIVCATLEVSN